MAVFSTKRWRWAHDFSDYRRVYEGALVGTRSRYGSVVIFEAGGGGLDDLLLRLMEGRDRVVGTRTRDEGVGSFEFRGGVADRIGRRTVFVDH